MANQWAQLVSMLIAQAPALLAYAAGLIVSLVLWSRYPRAALLTMLGSVILLVAAIGQPVVQTMILTNRARLGMSSVGNMLNILGFVFSITRAAGFVLLLCAAFVGRSQTAMEAFPMANPTAYPLPMPGR